MTDTAIQVDSFLALTLGIVVYFAGSKINAHFAFFQKYNIPEPVTGGILASLIGLGIYYATDRILNFDLSVRDTLLVYFFTTIGLNARMRDLVAGGRPLLVLLVLTLGYIVVQDIVGISAAAILGQPKAIGVLTGSTSLIGGHGTAIAWAPDFAKQHGITNALEIGIASATLGLVIASLLGGPIAKHLLTKYQLKGSNDDKAIVGISRDDDPSASINHITLMHVILIMHIAIVFGYFIDIAFTNMGLKLPLFVSCMLVAIIMSNTVPALLPKLNWPARTNSLALVSDFSLSLFIAMSLMGMQLASLSDLAGPLLILLIVQTIVAFLFIVYVLFPMMGKTYMAAVLSAGFAGFSLGATPTAVANMTAVTKTHGPAPTAFIILPLVGAFFVDITNAFIIQFFLLFS